MFFRNDKVQQRGGADAGIFGIIGIIVYVICCLGAMYSSYKCFGTSNILNLLLACICPIFYWGWYLMFSVMGVPIPCVPSVVF